MMVVHLCTMRRGGPTKSMFSRHRRKLLSWWSFEGCLRGVILILTFLCTCVILSIALSIDSQRIYLVTDTSLNDLVLSEREFREMIEDSDRMALGYTKQLPSCIIVGARKCGTRALLEFLNLHPDIQAADEEIHFFDNDTNYELGVDWYQRQMPYSLPNQTTLEKSPAYFITDSVPRRIYSMNNTVRLIMIFRNPITRAISDYAQVLSNNLAKNLTYARFEKKALYNGKVRTNYKALRISTYHQYAKKWLQLFPLHQIHIVDGDKLISDPISEIRKVEDFLGVTHHISPSHVYYNLTRGFYCMRHHSFPNGTRCLGSSKGRKHPSIGNKLLRKLNQYFKPHNRRLFTLIGRQFDWDLSHTNLIHS